ncbi:MAG: LytTR family transcriptional regulator DNA-binding domain-containing protein [Lachnospiraceae bacterium]|nr:LytTR family transcriptional regulator DNA-binding domain-containing protein [Lachnospiraceae bacterium]
MKNMVDIDVVLDENYIDPKVTIETYAKTKQVENIIYAIENASDNDFPQIVGYDDDTLMLISQRDILRAHVEGRRVVIQTDEGTYGTKKSLTSLEEDLNPERFIRISQSEIVNLYKIKCFDVSVAGTIGVEFDNGIKSWASRSCVRTIKDTLKKMAHSD